MKNININEFIAQSDISIRNSMKVLEDSGEGIIIIYKDNRVYGIVTDGDIRSAILKGVSLNDDIETITNTNFFSLSNNTEDSKIENIFRNTKARQIPIIENGLLLDIITEEDFFFESNKTQVPKKQLHNPVVFMAGGTGTRLDPFTRILPKALIPYGNDPILKVIMDNFGKFGMNNFFISINDKGRMIKAYFHDHCLDYNIDFIEEDKPLGTAGALKYLNGKLHGSFFVSNCDIIIHTSYYSVYKFHKKGCYDLTLLGSMRKFTIPYGVCDIDNNGELKGIREKPISDLLVNTGLYLMEPNVLNYIPEDKFFDMTDLIREIQKKGLKVGVYPVSEKSWIDVGQWGEYDKAIKELYR